MIKRTALHYCLKYWLVSEPFADSSARGVPSKITLPPLFPPSGPISMIQSSLEITSRLCSITITVIPALHQPVQNLQKVRNFRYMQRTSIYTCAILSPSVRILDLYSRGYGK